jgi:hypothetical protein
MERLRYITEVRAPALLASLALLLTACQDMPEPYAPPVQREPFDNFRPYRTSRIVNMADGDADAHIVSDISGPSGTWRWTGKHPAVRVAPRGNENLRYLIDFTIADVTFKETGPVTVSFFVNDHLLDAVHYATPGEQHFEAPVPADWVQPEADTIVAAEVDKVWTAPADGAKLGLILTRLGLTQ